MKHKVSEILKDVRVILDNNDEDNQLLTVEDNDTLTLDELIRSKIPDAARFVITVAPASLIGSGIPFADIAVEWRIGRGVGSGYFLLPSDFLRLVTFQMSDWLYPVSRVITEDSPLYIRQHSRFSGIRGNTERPVVALVNHPAGQMLEFYSCKGGEDVYVKSMRYIPMPKFYQGDCAEMIDLPDKLYDAVKYYTAYLTALALEMNSAASLAEITKTYLNK